MTMRFHADFSEWKSLTQEFLAMAKKEPALAREFLTLAGEDGVAIVQYTYANLPAEGFGRRYPSKFTGEGGGGYTFAVRAGTKQQSLTIFNEIAHMAFVESGRGPGGVPVDIIKAWAEEKLGLDPDGAEVRSIISSIRRFGVDPEHIMERSLGTGTLGGLLWDRQIARRLGTFMARLLGSGQ